MAGASNPPGAYEIRPFEARDIEPFMDLFEAVTEERLWLGTEPGFDRAARTRRFLDELLSDPDGGGFVAMDGTRLVGQCGIYRDGEGRNMLGISVASTHRGRGIGRMLMERAEQWARSRGLTELWLFVFAHNARALALYNRLGYTQREYHMHDVVRQTGEVYDTILMSKRLS